MEKFYTYIIYSATLDKFYIGHTRDLIERISQHNSGVSTFTSKANDWKLKWTKEFDNRASARLLEQEIKNKKSRKFILQLIQSLQP